MRTGGAGNADAGDNFTAGIEDWRCQAVDAVAPFFQVRAIALEAYLLYFFQKGF